MRSDYNKNDYHERNSNRRVLNMRNIGWAFSTIISRVFWMIYIHDIAEMGKWFGSLLNESTTTYFPNIWVWYINPSITIIMIVIAIWSIYRNGFQIFGIPYLAKWMAKEEFRKMVRAQRMKEREHRAQRIDISGRRDVDYYNNDHRIAK